jgi:5-methylcytosine-specific restriction endonuclease McrA
MSVDREAYKRVIGSKRWRDMKRRLVAQRGERCGRCGIVFAPGCGLVRLQLHHITYVRLGSERDEDVQLVCGICHGSADLERAQTSKARASHALYEARFSGWCERRGLEPDAPGMSEEFDSWLDGRGSEW